MARKARISRKTQETDIKLSLNLDGSGQYKIATGIPFLDHMLSLFALHGMFDLEIEARGDLEVDYHHTTEDIGICLGQAMKGALGDKVGIRRYGFAYIPMDETLISVALDISDRPHLVFNVPTEDRVQEGFTPLEAPSRKSTSLKPLTGFNIELAEEFLRAFSTKAGITIHVNLMYGGSMHHIIEATFKALGRALDQSTKFDPRLKEVPSTKGIL